MSEPVDYRAEMELAEATGIYPWDCEQPDPDQPCVRPGHKLLPCQWQNPEEWPR